MLYGIILTQFLFACGAKEEDTSSEPSGEASVEPSGEDTNAPESEIDALRAGDLVITEIHKNPCVIGEDTDGDGNLDCTLDDEMGEWFEIYNNTAESQNLKGLVVSDDNNDEEIFTVDEDVMVEAGAYAVFGNNADSATNGGYTADYAFTGGESGYKLSNGDDGIVLSNSNETIDSVMYDDGDTFPDDKGYSLILTPEILDAAQNDDGANWCRSPNQFGDGDFGTPGEENTCE
jgi:hypothetical protein